jgi:Ca2+-binding RTX toxin-like protein
MTDNREEETMRRLTLLAVLVGMMLALGATAAMTAVLTGTAKNDNIVGTAQKDTINGGGGNDLLYGKGGDDSIEGARGRDRLDGYSGNDRLFGGTESDRAYGSTGDDFLKLDLDESADYAFCGNGYDEVRVSANDFIGDETRAGDLDVVDPANAVLSCEKIVVNGIVVVQVPIPIP